MLPGDNADLVLSSSPLKCQLIENANKSLTNKVTEEQKTEKVHIEEKTLKDLKQNQLKTNHSKMKTNKEEKKNSN